MPDDLVTQLRAGNDSAGHEPPDWLLKRQAADEIERLREALQEAAQEAYDEIVDDCGQVVAKAAYHAVKTVARAALSPKPDD